LSDTKVYEPNPSTPTQMLVSLGMDRAPPPPFPGGSPQRLPALNVPGNTTPPAEDEEYLLVDPKP